MDRKTLLVSLALLPPPQAGTKYVTIIHTAAEPGTGRVPGNVVWGKRPSTAQLKQGGFGAALFFFYYNFVYWL